MSADDTGRIEGYTYVKVGRHCSLQIIYYSTLFSIMFRHSDWLTISVRSPGLPGQRFMMLEYRVPVYRNAPGISDAVD